MPKIDQVTTRGGDKGKTSLVDGSRVAKSSLRVRAYGTVDELNSCLGLVRCEMLPEEILKRVLIIQNELFDLGSELATPTDSTEADRVPNIRQYQIDLLEGWLEEANQRLRPAKNFILPGGSRAAAQLHIARTVARRAERELVAFIESGAEVNPCCLKFLNRLSDLCFVWARFCNNRGQDDILWQPGPHR